MIRRSTTLQDGSPGWLLISQRTHARLAGELAYRWVSLPEFGPPENTSDLLAAIIHHDDGWDRWDQRWFEHMADGVPIAFHEMDPAVSNRIWDESIELAESHGPLVTYIVARHFVRMRERSSSEDLSGSSDKFVDRNQRLCERSLRAWKELGKRTRSEMDLVELAVDGLQFFDNLSLILCLGKVKETIELTPPVPPAVSLCFEEPWRIRFRPNPIAAMPILEAEALEAPDRGLDAKSLKRAAVPRKLTWHLSDELL